MALKWPNDAIILLEYSIPNMFPTPPLKFTCLICPLPLYPISTKIFFCYSGQSPFTLPHFISFISLFPGYFCTFDFCSFPASAAHFFIFLPFSEIDRPPPQSPILPHSSPKLFAGGGVPVICVGGGGGGGGGGGPPPDWSAAGWRQPNVKGNENIGGKRRWTVIDCCPKTQSFATLH
jgi:hypothetical protein